MIISIPTHIAKALIATPPTKARYDINGLHVKSVAGNAFIEATDTCVAIRYVLPADLPDIDAIITTKAFKARETKGKFNNQYDLTDLRPSELIDGQFPSIDRLLESINTDDPAFEICQIKAGCRYLKFLKPGIAVQTGYLNWLSAIAIGTYYANGSMFYFNDNETIVLVGSVSK